MATNGTSHLTWPNVGLAAGVILTAAGGGWAIFQGQFAATSKQIDAASSNSEKEIEELRRNVDRFDNLVLEQIKEIRTELLSRRHEFVSQEEMKAFEKRVDQYMALPYLTRNEFEAGMKERDKTLQILQSQVDRIDRGKP